MSDRLEEIRTSLKNVHERLSVIRDRVTTRETEGKAYPIPVGYSTGSRRPVRDITRWMGEVEYTLTLILEELEELRDNE